MSLNPGRIVGIAIGAVAILGIGVYGPAMLLGPLPAVAVQVDDDAVAASGQTVTTPISLPETGSSALALVTDDASAQTLALAGDPAAVPIGGAAKLVTVLATLDSLPLPLTADGDGPDITIGPQDYTDYLRHAADGSRTLQVSPGETWSERDVIRAVLLASSNNHADTLVRWAFGGVERYVDAANAWLADNGFTATRVDDATGLSGDNVGTAEELTRLAALVLANPELAEMYGEAVESDAAATAPPSAPGSPAPRNVPDVVDHPTDSGVRSIARSFTDQAGLTFVYTSMVPAGEGEEPRRVIGAMLLMPDYETLDPAVVATLESAALAAQPVPVIVAGTRYGSVESAWGDRAELVASVDRADASWGAERGEASVTVTSFTTAPAGRDVGRVSVGDLASPLTLSDDIRDPGPIWRLTNPIPLVGAFFAGQAD